MAGSTTVKIPGEDGRDREVTLPEYAMDSTLRDLVKAMAGLAGTSEETKKALEKLGKDTNENFKGQTKEDRDREALAQKQLDSLKNLNQTVDNNKQVDDKNAGLLKEAFSNSASIMKNLFLGAISTASTALYNLVSTGYATGSALIDLNRQGVLFGETIDGLTNADALASVTALGMSASSAAGLIGDYSRVTATLGIKAITDHSLALGKETMMGSKFGMTMKELTEYMTDELEIRQSMGMINTLDGMRAQKSAKALFETQMQYSQVLGTAIEDLQKASDATLDDPMFQTMMARFDEMRISTEGFTNTLRDSQSRMASMGIDSKLIDEIGKQMFDITAFYSDSGQALFSAFASTGTEAGSEVTKALANINSLVASGTKEDLAEAQGMTAKLPDLMRQALTDMTPEGIESFRLVAQEVGGEMGSMLMSSLNSVRLFNRKLAEMGGPESLQEHLRKQFSDLAMASAAFDNAKNGINGAMDTVRMSFTGLLSGPAIALQNFMTKFSLALVGNSEKISEAISELVGKFFPDLNTATGTISEKLSNLAIGKIDGAIDAVIEWIKALDPEDIKDKVQKIKDFGIGLIDGLDTLVTGIGKVAGFFTSWQDDTASFWSKGAELFAKIFGVVFFAQAAVKLPGMLAGKAVSKLSGGGAGPGAVAGAGLGKSAAGIKMFGKALAGFPKAAIVGAAKLGAAIVVIAGAVAGSAWLLGKGLGSMAEGFAKFNDIDGMNLLAVGGGLIALSAGMVAFGAGAVVGAVGNILGGVLDGLNKMAGGTGIFDKLKTFGEMKLDVEGIKNNSEAVAAYGTAMAKIGAGTGISSFGNLIGGLMDGLNQFFGGKTPFEKMEEFGKKQFNVERIKENASAFAVFSEALNTASKANFDNLNDIGDIMDDVNDELEHLSDTKKIDPVGLKGNAEGLKVYASALRELARIDPGKIANLGSAIESLHESLQKTTSGPGLLEAFNQVAGQSLDAVASLLFSPSSESPSTEAMTNASTDGTEQSKATTTTPMVMAEINQDQIRELKKILESIDSKTVA
jgi:hypothetical protein